MTRSWNEFRPDVGDLPPAVSAADPPNHRAHNAYEAQLFFTGDAVRECGVDSFWNELPPLGEHRLTGLPVAADRFAACARHLHRGAC